MEKDFSQVMSGRTDKQLMDIITIKRNEYQPEAIIAAEMELDRRKISIEAFYTDEEIEKIKKSEETKNESKAFDWYHKVLTVLLPIIIGVIVLYLSQYFKEFKITGGVGFILIWLTQRYINIDLKEKGYFKMAAEFKKWVAYTIYIYIILIILLGIVLYIFH